MQSLSRIDNSVQSVPQVEHHTLTVPIRNLWMDKDRYNNIPDFQRQKVWGYSFKAALIDSILRGCPIHPILVRKTIDDKGEERYWVIDGQQRLATIYAFRSGEFKTQNRGIQHNKEQPIEPNKYFQEMTERAQNIFGAYKFALNVIDENTSMEYTEMLFRRIQHQMPLKGPEKLSAYSSKVVDYTHEVEKHSIWKDLYIGQTKHKEVFQGSLMVVALEYAQGYTSLRSNVLSELVSGTKDTLVSQTIVDDIMCRLDTVLYVFEGLTFKYRSFLVLMYQAVIFLQKEGYDLALLNKGGLTSWLARVLYQEREVMGRWESMSAYYDISQQKRFWEMFFPEIKEMYNQSKDKDEVNIETRRIAEIEDE